MDSNLNTSILQICRTCMKEIIDASFLYIDCVPLANTQLTISQTLSSCIPELDLSIVPNALMCKRCVDILLSFYEFKKNCLESNIKIHKYIQQVQHTGDLNLVEIVRFHQPDVKNLEVEKVKIEDLDITENSKNYLNCETIFNETSECKESFHLLDIKSLHSEIKIEDFEITEDLVGDNSAFNEASECIQSTETKHLLELEKVDTQYLLFNTEENSNTHNSNIAQNCLGGVIVDQHHNYNKNLEIQFSCSICEFHCNSKTYLKQHMLIHAEERPFSCSVCKYQFRWKKNLYRHMQIHTEEKPFSCSVCEYQCRQKSYLKLHMLTHAREKQFSCSFCEYQCHHKQSLKQHILIHAGQKLFTCSVCQYQCNRKTDLKRHLVIHTGEKPFSCSVCEHQCNLKSNLKKHMKTHTRE